MRGDRSTEAEHRVHLGQLLGQFGAVPLGHAPGHHQPRPGATALTQGEDRVDGLSASLLNEGAGVDDDEFGIGGVVDRGHPVREEGADELVGVDLVLRTAQCLDVEAPRADRFHRG